MAADERGRGTVGVYHNASSVDTSGPLRSPREMQSSPVEDFPYLKEDTESSMPPDKHCRHWSEFLHHNAVQRVMSAAVLAPAVTAFLWMSPAFAVTTVCSFMISTCAYEYACLANRIRLRILTQLEAMEGLLDGSTTSDRRLANYTSLNDTRSNHSITSSRESVGDDSPRSPMEHSTSLISPVRARSRFSLPDARVAEEERENREIAIVDDELRNQEDRIHHCAVTGIAVRFFDGHVWWAAGAVSIPMCILTSAVFLYSIEWITTFKETEFYEYRWFFAVCTGYVVSLCACLTPDWQYAFITLVKYAVFTILTLQSSVCPMNELNCNLVPVIMTTTQIFLGGMAIILVFRFASTPGKAEAFVSFMLDVVGLLYVTGTLSVLVAFVDDNHRTLYRKLLIALLYIVWASDTGAYIIGKALAYCHYPYYNPLAAHLSKNKDYEGTLGAIIFGIITMVVASNMLELPGSFGLKVCFTVLAVVVGRMGDLFESLLKRAAGVKDSGTLIPGHGGVLDRIDALMFATIVFSRYYAMQA